MALQKEWWQTAVFYQIYPRSFKDSTNNGVGDLPGIISKLDYLADLGIDAIWFSPFFPSPQADFGYDITDYGAIHPEYGTMDDFDELLVGCHNRGIKVILDMVLNHTSDQHPWFLESKTSQDNPRHDWYVWQDGRGKKGRNPPNNWRAMVGGSAWEWSDERKQFYLHQFLTCQPDLNWRNHAVQEAMFDHLRFWLDKGVDGFRLDIIHTVFEDKEFRDNPRSWHIFPSDNSNEALLQKPVHTQFLPETIDLCVSLREIVDSYSPPRVLVGEAQGGVHLFKPLYGSSANGLNMVFNFEFSKLPFNAKRFGEVIQSTEKALPDPYWPCYVFSNHDVPRMISKHGNNEQKAKLLVLLLLTLRGTPFIYYGEEIGLQNVNIPKQRRKDPLAHHRVWGIPIGRFFGRDGCRTPMQWTNDDVCAGFSDPPVRPWLPVGNNSQKNVLDQLNDNRSMLEYYKRLLRLRKDSLPLKQGLLTLVEQKNSDILMFERSFGEQSVIVVLNFSSKQKKLEIYHSGNQILFSTHGRQGMLDTGEKFCLQEFEGLIIK